ncbi:MAG: EAL domain-containing protein [Acidimicrobiales bacterium]
MRDGKSKPSPESAECAPRSPHTEGIVPGSAHIEAERARVATKKRGTAGPAIAELIAVERKAGRDLAWIVAASVVICTFSISFDLVDRLFDLSAALNSRNFNGLITLLFVAPFATGGYAALRYREGMRAQRQLTRLSVHDSLTGLPNRRFLGESFARMLSEQRRGPGRVAVLFMDLAGFKAVNDTYGHEVGDRLMQAVADRLQTAVKPEDAVVRYGGDEFVLVITDVPSTQVAERIAARVVKVIEMPFELGNDRIQISASIGIALAEANCEVPEDVVRDADAAMYQAKGHGPGTLASFDRSMNDRLTPSTAEKRLREAVEREEFSLWYQPIVSLRTRRIVGAEALLRWDHPELGAIRPDDFLPALEDSGLIVPVGRWVIAEACAQSRAWADVLPDGRAMQVTVNLSARQIKQADFVDHLREIVRGTNANPETIFLEIDDRALSADRGLVWQALRGAKRLGFRLALDDFGAGLSSLRHLHDFELDMLKIDPTYVAGLGVDTRGTAIVQHVVGLAKALSVITLAESVETADQVETLRTLGCDLAQGFLFSAPAPASAITKMLTQPVAAPEPLSSTPTQLVNAASWPRDPT